MMLNQVVIMQVNEVRGLSQVGSKLQVVSRNHVVVVSGDGIDFSPQWRHAGMPGCLNIRVCDTVHEQS
jgi:hypothetical protein